MMATKRTGVSYLPITNIYFIKVHSVTVPTCSVVQGLHGLRAKPNESTDFNGGDVSLKKKCGIQFLQEVMSRGMKLHYIPATAFS